MIEIKTKKVKLKDLRVNPDNPRTITEKNMERLVKSLQEFPEMMELREIVVDETMMVLCGNMRYRGLQSIGAKECIAKVVTGLTPEQKRELVIKDNSAFGAWEMGALANEWSDLPLADWGVPIPEDWMVGDSGAENGGEGAEPQIDKADELLKKWKVETGQVWQIGRHRLMCGDSTKKKDIESIMNGQKTGTILTDPPYQMGKDIENDDLSEREMIDLHERFIQWLPISIDATFICFHSPRTFPMVLDAARKDGWKFRRALWLYRKNDQNTYPWHGWLMKSEIIVIFTQGKGSWPVTIDEYHHDVYEFLYGNELDDRELKHPTIKPLWVIKDIISKLGNELICDPFLGSGTTMVAAEQTGRICYGMEIEPKYCAVTLQRMADSFPGIEIKKNA